MGNGDILSVGFLGLTLCIYGPMCFLKPWSYVELVPKEKIEGCKLLFSQYVGLDWINQCNCNPRSHKFMCNMIDIKSLGPQNYYIHLGGSLVKFVFLFAILSTLGSLVFVILRGKSSDRVRRYKSYVVFLTLYTTILYFASLLLWSFFVHSPLNTRFVKPNIYTIASGWSFCLVSLITCAIATILQITHTFSNKLTTETYDREVSDEEYEGDYS